MFTDESKKFSLSTPLLAGAMAFLLSFSAFSKQSDSEEDSVWTGAPKAILDSSIAKHPSISVGQPTACMTPWGTRIGHGQSVTAYLRPETTKTERCIPQTRSCWNGTLQGSYQYQVCAIVDPPQHQCWNGEVLDYDMPCLEVTTETRTLSCPSGWSGTHQQQRTRTYRSFPYQLSYTEWRDTIYSCVAPPPTILTKQVELVWGFPDKTFYLYDEFSGVNTPIISMKLNQYCGSGNIILEQNRLGNWYIMYDRSFNIQPSCRTVMSSPYSYALPDRSLVIPFVGNYDTMLNYFKQISTVSIKEIEERPGGEN